ncbi:MAG: hypothetical protein ACODAE_04350 [Gemmatimonadota bacterium]
MGGWAGIALALRGSDADAMRSRLPTYLHPLAGRVLAWHVLRTVADLRPRPQRLWLAAVEPLDPSITGELPAEVVDVGEAAEVDRGPLSERIAELGGETLLLVDAAAAVLSGSLARLVAGPAGRAVRDAEERPLAVWLEAGEALERGGAAGFTLEALAEGLPEPSRGGASEQDRFAVRDRASFARASRLIRDRIVERLMAEGVTILLPETVLVDVDVTVEPDTVIYPGVVLEGQTTIGSETVIGPGCRIIDSRIGSGVELKGWNYIVGTSIRNRAVLEPYVRRGHD